METRRRIVIAEDHTILREGLRVLLSSHPDLEVVGEAVDGREAIRKAEEAAPDLVLIDLSMPKMNGMDAIHEIRKRSPDTKILALTVHKAEEYVLTALQAGADGYALKDSTHQELVTAIRSVLAGKRYLSPGVSEQVIEGYLAGKKAGGPKSLWESVTPREREVLKLIAEGHKNREIAELLCISVKTVEKHRSNIMEKLDLHNVSDLTAYAIDRGIVTR